MSNTYTHTDAFSTLTITLDHDPPSVPGVRKASTGDGGGGAHFVVSAFRIRRGRKKGLSDQITYRGKNNKKGQRTESTGRRDDSVISY